MFRNTNKMVEVVKKIAETYGFYDEAFIKAIVYALDDVLSLNDFNTLIKRLEEDVEEDIEE
jgi:hypothetical protein